MLSIIIPVFNQSGYTRACIDALSGTCGDFNSYEVIIIDNCSSDDTPSVIEEFQNRKSIVIKYIKNTYNSGFTLASNQGAKAAIGDTLVFLNNDTIPQSGWRETLENSLNNPEIGIVGPKLLYPNTLEVNHAGYVYSPKIGGFYPIYQNFPGDFSGALKERTFQALLGACLMMKRKLFEEIDGFTEIGLEDIDLCLKVREKGLQVKYVPSALVYHHGSVTQINSAIGTTPIYNNSDFNQRWKDRGLEWDDFNFYIDDGILPYISKEDAIRSYTLLQEALILIDQGDSSKAHELLSKSIAVYPGNTDTLSELLILALEKVDTEKTKSICLEILKQGCNFCEAVVFVAMVYKKLGMKPELIAAFDQIEKLQWASSDSRALMLEIRQKIK